MQTVLLVNDSRLEARILSDQFQSLGYVVTLSDEMQALEDVKRLHPDFVVVNYIMKTMQGDALIGMMKLLCSDAVSILTSSSDLAIESFRHRRVDGLLRTPVTREELARGIRDAQAHQQAVRHPA